MAFVGQRVYFEPCALADEAGGLQPAFVDLRTDMPAPELAAAIEAIDPHVVIAFRPDYLPHGALADLDAVTIGWLTEPLPRDEGPAHRDLQSRLETLRAMDAAQLDRIVSFDPLIAPTADTVAPVWRSLPLPVSDPLYALARAPRGRPQLLFVGRSTEHRERFLGPLKHDLDVVHIAHGVAGPRLRAFTEEADVAINLHNEPYPTFENRVQASLSAGLLVLSEPLSPRHGLQPGIDYLEAAHPGEMWHIARRLAEAPGAFHPVRLAGRRQAERFRASRVYPRLVRDALADVAAFGGRKTNGRLSATSRSRGAERSRSETTSSSSGSGHEMATSGSS